MKLKDILAKVAKGEDLTDAEKQFLAEHDPDKAVNDAAAAARRKAEEKATALEKERDEVQKKIDEMQSKLDAAQNAGKTDLEKAQNQISQLSKQFSDLQGKLQATEQEKTAMQRNQKLSDVRRQAGIQFVEGLDHGMLEKSFAAAFEGVDGLDDENVVKLKVDTWKAMNKAAILDSTGHGAGSTPHVGGGGTGTKAVTMRGDDLLDMAKTGSLEDAEKALSEAEQADVSGMLTLN